MPEPQSSNTPARAPSQWEYWSFYWPLALNGMGMLLARHCQNGTLARYSDATRELAIFALAQSAFQFFNAGLSFIPQMANVLARSRPAQRVCLRFVACAALTFCLPLAFLAYTGLGRPALHQLYGIQGPTLDGVARYLRFLAPLVFVNGLRHYFTGLLIQTRRTGYVTCLNSVYMASIIGGLLCGFHQGWPAIMTLALSQVCGACLHLLLVIIVSTRIYQLPVPAEYEQLAYGRVWSFFWPVAITSSMFSFSRPIIYFFVGRMPEPEPIIAALRVAFDCAMLFHLPMNQFRHLFVTFGRENLPRTRRFMLRILAIVVVVMLVANLTPALRLYLQKVLKIGPDIQGMSLTAVWVLCLIPLVATMRNYYHGMALLHHRTRGMALGGLGRNLSIALAAALLCRMGWLDHGSAAACLVLGFSAETFMVWLSVRRFRVTDQT